ncbi:MAG: glycine cleavage system protein GcvH [Planctomycetota bacterium]|jgi:glycine cleavage system H protein|nr:glycine cleavage system protein GcvH [Planctomycetota bacterium]MSR38414.1 glycine cleavage system protein GcvH [Planctomycetota bacterium]
MRPNDRSYLKSHEWCKIENGIATIGITDFAVSHLSDLVFLDLPNKGGNVTIGESFGEIESVKAVSDLYSPVSGEIIEVNKDLTDNLEWLSSDPFAKAWMLKIKVTSLSQELQNAAAYEGNCVEG